MEHEKSTREELWKASVFSDGTSQYVSALSPKLGETVAIRLRMLEESPVEKVYLRYICDGSLELSEMHPAFRERGLIWYETKVPMTQRRLAYQFYLVCPGEMLYYTQAGLFGTVQDEDRNFVLLSDYVQPAWVKYQTFYQIFPERFARGDEKNRVKDGEFYVEGYPARAVPDWNDRPKPYEESRCLDFYGGDLEGIRQKIPYLKKLGITALYLNPIFAAPSVHKYDCVDYEEVDPHFGGNEALARLSEELHENGMRLVLDISVNHTGTAHKWFNRDALFYPEGTGAYADENSPQRQYYLFEGQEYKGWRGNLGLPQLNYKSKELRRKIYEGEDAVLRKWLRPPYAIDGWRFDVADVMAKQGPDQLDHEVWQGIRRAIREENPEAYILAEEWGDSSEYLRGDEWDSAMNYYGCARVLRPFLGMPEPYMVVLRGDFARLRRRMNARELRDRILGYLSRLPFAFWQNQFNLLDSHDFGRMHNDPLIDPEELRGAIITQFTMIGAPSLYYGDEAEIEGWTETMEGCRFPMPWGSGFEERERFKLYQKLAKLRKEHRAFAEGSFRFLYAEGQIFAFARETKEDCFLTVMSGEGEDREIFVPLAVLGAENYPEADMMGRPLRQGKAGLLVRAHETLLIRLR